MNAPTDAPAFARAGLLTRGDPAYFRVTAAFCIGGFSIFELLYCVQPLLPVFAREFHLAPADASLAVSFATIAMAPALFLAGLAADLWGRKSIMIAALLVSSSATLATALAPNWPVLLVLRALMGLALAGLPSLAMAYLVEEIAPSALGLSMGLYIAGSTIGGMFGRLAVSVISDHYPWRVAIAFMGTLSLIGALFFARALPRERAFKPKRPDLAALARTLGRHFRDPGLRLLFAQGYLVMGAFICTYNYIGFRLAAAPFSFTQTTIGLIFTLYLVGAASSAIMGDLAGRIGRRRVLWIASAIAVAGAIVTLPDNIWTIVLGVAMVTWGFFGAHSIASSWVGLRAETGRAQAAALYLFFYYIGSSFNGWLGGVAYSHFHWAGVAGLVVAMMLLALLIALRLSKVPPPKHLQPR